MKATQGAPRIAIYQNAFLIYNPFAGKLIRNRKGELLERTISTLREKGHTVTAIPTEGPGTAKQIATQCIVNGADLILAAGGDGTVNEIVNGMVHSSVPLAVMPAGTANVLAVEIGVGTGMVRAARHLDDCQPARISVGLVENESASRHFLLMAGVGFDAMIVYNLDAKLKAALGKAAYWLGGFSHIARPLPEFDVSVNGSSPPKTSRCSFALASRVSNYGGDLQIAREASLFNDHFELVLFEGANTLPYVKYLLGIMTGRLAQTRGVSIIKTNSISLGCSSDPGIYIQIDGEYLGKLPAKLSIVPRSLTLMVPRSNKKAHPVG